MSRETRRGRPGQVAPSVQLAHPSLASVDLALDDIAQHVGGTFVLVVETTGGRYRRRCFLTTAAAQRAGRRAQEAGHCSRIYLAELRPLWRLQPGQEGAS